MTDRQPDAEAPPAATAAPTQPPLLAAEHLTRQYADVGVRAVDDVSLEISSGEYVSLVGKSGCGKSTLLNLLGGLDRPTSGRVLFRGQPLEAYGDLARFRARELGFIFQSFHLVSVLTAVQNVQLPLFETPLRAAQREARGRELLERVGMAHRADYRAGKLSGGERQRVAIARALACDPSLLLADEPTGNLDSKTADEIIDLFRDLHASGKTILMVTHDAALASEADRTLTMHDGQLV